jgi:hypothetical protein
MHKNWAAMLSMIGLAGSAVRVQSQAVNGSANGNQGVTNAQGKTNQKVSAAGKTANSGKLSLNQQTLRQQNQGSTTTGKGNTTLSPSTRVNGQSGTSVQRNAVTKGNNNAAVTKGSPNKQVTKGSPNAQVTKGSPNYQVTKGSPNAQVTKGAQTQGPKNNAVATTAGAAHK